jgi:hypothetical protein
VSALYRMVQLLVDLSVRLEWSGGQVVHWSFGVCMISGKACWTCWYIAYLLSLCLYEADDRPINSIFLLACVHCCD